MEAADERYGDRFAEAWQALQGYLGELDPGELRRLRSMGRSDTWAVLRREPVLGQSGSMASPKEDKGPEELALEILQERLDALREALPRERAAEQPRTWGQRFLAEWRRAGLPLSQFSYSQIQKLKGADRKQLIDNVGSQMTFALRRAIEDDDPEELARRLAQERIARGQSWGVTLALMGIL